MLSYIRVILYSYIREGGGGLLVRIGERTSNFLQDGTEICCIKFRGGEVGLPGPVSTIARSPEINETRSKIEV